MASHSVPPPPPPPLLPAGSPVGEFRPLVVDELDVGAPGRPRSPAFDPAHIRGSDRIKPRGTTRGGGSGGLGGKKSDRSAPPSKGGVHVTIGPLDPHAAGGSDVHACPCCRRYVPGASPSSVTNTPDQCGGKRPGGEHGHASPDPVAREEREAESESRLLLGSLALRPTGSTDSGSSSSLSDPSFDVKEILAKGWVHKKGTGKDWLGSRSWKPRWAVLATASVPGYDVDVPLLLVYWYSASDSPSNVIVLDDGTVVVPVDRYKSERKVVEWNTYTFEVVHNRRGQDGVKEDQEDQPVTRAFSVPEKERNEWVFNIDRALRDYERRQTKFRNDLAAREAKEAATRALMMAEELHCPFDEVGAARPTSPRSPDRGGGSSFPSSRATSPPPLSPRPSSGGDFLKPPLSPRPSPTGGQRPLLKPPLSPKRSPPRASMAASMKSLKTLSPPRPGAGRAAAAAAAAAAESEGGATTTRLKSSLSLNYSMTSAASLDESALAGLNISLPED